MNQKQLIISMCVVVIGVGGVLGYRYYQKQIHPNIPVHYHAGFIVYVNGIRQDFGDSRYMKIEPCTTAGSEIKEDDQLEKAHLHGGIGDVVHVHREGALWKEFFVNIKYSLPKSTLSGYINTVKTDNLLNVQIRPYDSVVFVFGDVPSEATTAGISKEHIIEVEKTKEQCGIGQ